MAKKSNFKPEDLFDSFLDEAFSISLNNISNTLGIVEFAEDVIFNGEGKLYPTQKAILKAFYGEPLSEDELLLLYDWKEEHNPSRTTWVDGRKYKNLAMEIARRGTKALALDTPILTSQGWKTMQDIKPGDYVFSDKGKPVKIIAESEIFTDSTVYEVQFSDDSFIIADAQHLWLTWDKSARVASNRSKTPRCLPQIRTTQEIKDTLLCCRRDGNKELNHSINLAEPLEFPEADLPIHPYLLGLWLGDGNSRDARVTINKEDSKEILFKLEYLGYEYTISQYKENCYTAYFKNLRKFLKELNLLKNKHIPEIYLFSSVQQRLELLRGLMDSDGTVDKRGHSRFTNTNYSLIEGIYFLAVSLESNPTITANKAYFNGKDCGVKYDVYIRPNKLNPFFLSRKAERFKACTKQANKRFITNVISVPSQPVKCIQVEGGMYLAGKALIPTHNSTMVSLITLYEFYKLINLPQPAIHYGFLAGSPLHIFVIAQSLDQVKDTIFSAITGYAKGSNYFKKLEKEKKIEILTEEIRCEEKNVHIFAKHTNSKSLVGYNLKLLVIDEAARFENDEFGNSKADEIWENVGAGCKAFGDEGLKIAISSAWEPGDYIERLYTDLAEKDPKTLGFRLRTWDVNLNPTVSEANLKSSDDYIKNPMKAALEYEGIRTLKQGTFFVKENVTSSFKGFSACDAMAIPLDLTNEEGETRNYAGIQITRIQPTLTQSFAHCDYGIKKDGAALAVCSPVEVESGKWGVSVDILMLWKPYIDKDKSNRAIKRIVSFTNCEEVFLEVAKNRRVQKFSFDSYQCLKIGSLILTPKGLLKVEDLVEGMEITSQFGTNKIVNLLLKEEVDTITITTKLGYTLTGTLNHPIKNKEDNWVRLDELKLKDKIKLFSSNSVLEPFDFSVELAKNEHLALITGYLIAEGNWEVCKTFHRRKKLDGSITKVKKINQYIGFTNAEECTVNDYINSFKQVFNDSPNIYKRVNKKTNNFCYSVRYSKKEGLNYWNSLNLPTGSWNKDVPDFILQGTDREISLFLSGLFEGDGCCQPRDNKIGGSAVTLVTVSKSLASKVQLLLLKFGIKSSVKYWHYKQKKGLADIRRYTLNIYGHNLINFQKYINFRSSRKKNLLQTAVANLSFYRVPRSLYLEDSIVLIEKTKSSIIQMEVNGDHSYIAQGFINHNSQSTIQRLHLAGFHTCEMSTATQMQNKYFTTTKLLMDHGLLILPKDSFWSTSAELELQNIIQLPNGKITHSTYAKDLADAICNSVYNCYLHMIQTGKLTSNSTLIAHVNSISNKKDINSSAVHKLKAQSGSAIRKLKAE